MTADSTTQPDTARFEARKADWRIGAMTYQVFVDRFAPSANLDQKKHLYEAPRTLREWHQQPRQEEPSDKSILWTHELAFWGGDLQSLTSKLDYIESLGIRVLYLNPIFKAQSNHKYDTINFDEIAPEYGALSDLQDLASALEQREMRLVLDGVFNHVGYQADWFQDALKNPDSTYRDWFYFDDKIQNGYVGWWGVANLPELNWHNPEVRDTFVKGPDSIVAKYFQYGIDGWRLDVATELGFEYLRSITDAAHLAQADSLVIGEVWSYPQDWSESLDAVMNFTLRRLMFDFTEGKLSGRQFTSQISQMVLDTGLEPLLRSWLILDNHDTPRLKTLYPVAEQRRLLQGLQLTLPGSPLIYYGVEVGMEGGEDPESRGPMDWQGTTTENPDFREFKQLVSIREQLPALKIGDFVPMASEQALAFMRLTDKAEETVLVIANNHDKAINETLMLRDPRIMNGDQFIDQLSGQSYGSHSGVLTLTVPAHKLLILTPDRWTEHHQRTGHSPYKHIR